MPCDHAWRAPLPRTHGTQRLPARSVPMSGIAGRGCRPTRGRRAAWLLMLAGIAAGRPGLGQPATDGGAHRPAVQLPTGDGSNAVGTRRFVWTDSSRADPTLP